MRGCNIGFAGLGLRIRVQEAWGSGCRVQEAWHFCLWLGETFQELLGDETLGLLTGEWGSECRDSFGANMGVIYLSFRGL